MVDHHANGRRLHLGISVTVMPSGSRAFRPGRPGRRAIGAAGGLCGGIALVLRWRSPRARARRTRSRSRSGETDPADPRGVLLRLPRHGVKKGRRELDGLDADEAGCTTATSGGGRCSRTCGPASCPRPASRGRPPRSGGSWRTGSSTRAFGIDPKDPDPGRVTVRRLNRVEYRNTIRDLMGVDYDTDVEFPPDDTGHGFDNIGDVLTLSPLLLEKYLAAAESIVARAVPTVPRVVAERSPAGVPGQGFRRDRRRREGRGEGPLTLSYYEPATVSATFQAEHAGRYQLVLDLTANERYVDGGQRLQPLPAHLPGRRRGARPAGVRPAGRASRSASSSTATGRPGAHELTLEVQPLTPGEKQVRSLAIRIESVTVRGPLDEQYWVRPAELRPLLPGRRPRRTPPGAGLRPRAPRPVRRAGLPPPRGRRDGGPARRRWPRRVSAQEGQTFEAGVAQAMAAVLASPRFLFREEAARAGLAGPVSRWSTSTPWPRGCRTSSGRPCPTTS